MTIIDGIPRSLSELNSRPSRWCIRVPRENEYCVTIPPGVDFALIAGICICFDEAKNDDHGGASGSCSGCGGGGG